MKIGPGPELEVGVALVPDRRAGDVGGHEVGGELDAREARARAPARTSAPSERLREAWEVLEQHVPVGEEPEQDELERLALADDGLLDLVEHPVRELPNPDEFHVRRAPASRRRESSSAGVMPRLTRSSGAGRDRRGRAPTSLRRVPARRRLVAVEVDASPGREQTCGNDEAAGRSRYWRSKEPATPSAASCSRRARLAEGGACVARLRRIGERRLGRIRRADRAQSDDEGHAGRRSARRSGPPARGGPGRRPRRARARSSARRGVGAREDVASHEVTARPGSGTSGLVDGAPAARPEPVRVRRSRPPSSSESTSWCENLACV